MLLKNLLTKKFWSKKDEFEKKNYQLTVDVMKKAGDLGFLGVGVPEKYGGLGMPFTSTMLVCDYISGSSGSTSTAFGAHTGIGTMPILLYGNESQKQKYIPKLATGEFFEHIVSQSQEQDLMLTVEKLKLSSLKIKNTTL